MTRLARGALSALLEEIAHRPERRADPDAAWPLPGAVIGRFELLREIGRGGFGVVYEARDRELHRSVAFKLVRPGRLQVGEDQLRREAEVIAALAHPNLVTLFDVGRCEHGPYLVLEFLRGRTLQDRIAEGRLPPAEAVRVAADVARGLAHAHAQGVVHRDLKPSNVFLCDDGQVKLLDFGLAHAFGWRRLDGGTPAYMAPEQWRGAPEDERTDVYALGVMLFQLLAGELPFHADRAKGADRRAPPLETPGYPALASLVARMLEPEPTRRPRDAREVADALDALRSDIARGAPPAPARRVRRSARRLLALAAAGVLLGAGAFAGVALRRERAAPRARAIAVLPFANLGSTADSEYFSDGLAEEILNLLTRVRELKVAASASSFRFKDKKVEVAEVAERLRVDVLLVGTVRRDHEHLRVGAELVDAHSGFRVWSQIYDRRLEDVFAIQDDIARQVVGALALVLAEGDLRRAHTPGVAAYDVYLRARDTLRRPRTAENLARATEAFDEAVAADPDFAAAHAGLCEAWLARYERGREDEAFHKAEGACRAALARDPKAGEVHVALGSLYRASGRYDDAQRELKEALASAPAHLDALLGVGRTYAAQRRVDDAEAAFRKAAAADPGDWRPYQQLGRLYYANGRHGDAAAAYREVIARTPDNAPGYGDLGAAYYMAGRFAEAAEAWRKGVALAPNPEAYSNTGSGYFYLGRFEDAAAMYRKAVELAPGDHRYWGNLADASFASPQLRGSAREAYGKAATLAEARLRVNPADAASRAQLAHYEARLGHAARAAELIGEALARDAKSMEVQYYAALVSASAGDRDGGIAHLERALAGGYQRQLLAADPGLAALREDPRWAALAGGSTSR